MSAGLRTAYRKRDSSPLPMPVAEQLDRSLYVTSPAGWIALVAILSVVTVAAVWSVVGEGPRPTSRLTGFC